MGFKYNDITSTSMNVTLLKTPISLMPATRDKIIVLPGKTGTLRYKPDIHERIWTLDCMVEGSDNSNLWVKVRDIEAWLLPDGIKALIFDNTPTYVWAAILTGEINVEVRGVRYGFFTITFACPESHPAVQLTSLTENLIADFVPAFVGSTYVYTLAAINAESEVTLTATLTGATIKYTYGLVVDKEVASGVGEIVPLAVGANIVKIKVSKPFFATMTYRLTITRAAA